MSKEQQDWEKYLQMPPEEALQAIAQVISVFGRTYNGYEIKGLDHLPKDRGALIVYYHGLVPLDAWYAGMEVYLKTGRLIRGLADNFVFQTPGLKNLAEAVGLLPGRPEAATELLKKGNWVAVSPGGVREALAGTSKNYELVWGARRGFAKVAQEAKVDIIPAFTENIEEIYRAPFSDHRVLQGLYEKTRLPLVPILGVGPLPFPVKLTTWFGEPIKYHPRESHEGFANRARIGIEELIEKHQSPKTDLVTTLRKRFLGL